MIQYFRSFFGLELEVFEKVEDSRLGKILFAGFSGVFILEPKRKVGFSGFFGVPGKKISWRQETDPEPQILFGIERR